MIPCLRCGASPGPELAIITSHNETPGDLQNLVPDLPRMVMAGTSHWPHLDKPDEFNRLRDEFLATIK